MTTIFPFFFSERTDRMRRVITVELLRNGELLYRNLELDYGGGGGDTESVNLLQVVRDRLCNQEINMQVHISSERPTREINWRHVILQPENSMEKSTLDKLRDEEKHIIINTTYRSGPVYRDVMADRCLLYK